MASAITRRRRSARLAAVAAVILVAACARKMAPGSLPEGDYWAIVGFDVRANGIDLDAPLGPDNASSVQLHADKEGAAPAEPDAASKSE